MVRSSGPATLQVFDGRDYRSCPVGDAPVIIGGRHAAIRVPGSTASKQHPRVFREDGRVWIEDLAGDDLCVNGAKAKRAPLRSRDKVRVGSLELQFWLV
jgi:pSer/pThr/pTyr-binding forkhead associated (FHA) protein